MKGRYGWTGAALILAVILTGEPAFAQTADDAGAVPRLSPGGTPLVSPGGTPLVSPGGTPLSSPADSIQLVYDREVFNYPGYDRRNPFQPLTGESASGPRFEDLVLMGRIMSSNPASSIALIGARTPGSQSASPARAHRMRIGDVLGNTRLLEIRDRTVVLEVVEFGNREARVLEMRRSFTAPEAPPAELPMPAGGEEPAPTEPVEPTDIPAASGAGATNIIPSVIGGRS